MTGVSGSSHQADRVVGFSLSRPRCGVRNLRARTPRAFASGTTEIRSRRDPRREFYRSLDAFAYFKGESGRGICFGLESEPFTILPGGLWINRNALLACKHLPQPKRHLLDALVSRLAGRNLHIGSRSRLLPPP